jgi:alcohol dehydrogenase class IV
MDLTFEFHTAPEIYFGNGKINNLPEHCNRFGKRVLLVKGGQSLEKSGHLFSLLDKLDAKGFTVQVLSVTSEPEVDLIDNLVEQAKSFHPDVIAAIGGGSVLDATKAVAGLITNGGSIMDYLEGVGKGKIIEKAAVPFIAAPTTSGTGTEVTKNAVISSRTMKFKKSIRHQYLIPRIAIIDPELTLTQPPDVTAACGMDALTQLIEPYLSIKSNPFTDAICMKGIELVSKSLLRAYNNGSDLEARENMCLASLMGGMVLANAGLGSVHGIAAPLGAFFPLAHGVACATVLPAAFHINSLAIAKSPKNSFLTPKFADVSRILTGFQEKNDRTAISTGVAWLNDLKRELKIPTLSKLGILESDLPFIVSESRGSSMKTNPVVLSDEEIGEILRLSM